MILMPMRKNFLKTVEESLKRFDAIKTFKLKRKKLIDNSIQAAMQILYHKKLSEKNDLG